MKTMRFGLLTLGLALLVMPAHAQTASVSAHIPFDFIIGKQVYPAGNYLLRSTGSTGDAVIVRNTDESVASITLASKCAKATPSEKTALIFHRLGDRYFLSQVWMQGHDLGREFPLGPVEKQMARNNTDRGEVILAGLLTR